MSVQEEEIVFEEDEVVWAKIRGYPWWPAYINELHPISDQENEYTVVFFGDNTNARVDSFKIRKFIDSYIECYLKAKTNRKLMTSINMAEDKLRQNDQNVEIFQDLRSRIKDKKGRGRPRDPNESHSHVIESGDIRHSRKASQNQIFEENQQPSQKNEPMLMKSKEKRKTHPKKGNGKTDDASGKKQIDNMEPQSSIHEKIGEEDEHDPSQKPKQITKQNLQQKAPVTTRKASGARQVEISIDIKAVTSPEKAEEHQDMVDQQEESQKIVVASRRRRNKQKKDKDNVDQQPGDKQDKDQIRENSQANGEHPSLERHKTEFRNKNQGRGKVVTRKKAEMQNGIGESAGKDQEEDMMQLQAQKIKQPVRSFSSGHPLSKGAQPIVPQVRKRGRPKKVQIVRDPSSQEDYQETAKLQNQVKRKIIRKTVNLPAKEPYKPKGISIVDETVISGVRKLLHNREALIDYLSRSTITVDNVKEILDMDVSQILQEGTVNEQVSHLLELMRAALVYKYFPDDIKYRKKYEKLTKRKNLEVGDDEQKDVQNEKEHKAKNIPMEEEEKDPSAQNEEIRKKTGLKVKKFLSGLPQSEQRIGQLSHQIEDYINKADPSVGQRYRRIAFLVLSALKQKKQNYQQIINKLESKLYD